MMTNQFDQPVAVITGASSGIGKEAAKALAAKGWIVICIGRNPERCALAKDEILTQARSPNLVHMICADLALMSDTDKAARTIKGLTDRIDALLNNAGGVTADLTITVEGNENTFASNHLGHFLLTNKLMPLLQRSVATTPNGTTRIISVSSTWHESTDGLDWNDLQSIDNFISGAAYCRAKLANILFTRELVNRYSSAGIVAHAMHPGVVHSNFVSHADAAMQQYMGTLEGETPEVAADTLIWLASADEPGKSNGLYYYQREAIATSKTGQDDSAAKRLWLESEKLVANYI